MTLAQIMKLALRQLDEDTADISEYDDMFIVYANIAYRIAAEDYVKPREELDMKSDGKGYIELDESVRRVVSISEKRSDGSAMPARFRLAGDGKRIYVHRPDTRYRALCEVSVAPMQSESETPRIPEELHPAIADYICYRHLINGNQAKQTRAQQYLQQYYTAMQRVRPQGMGSVREMQNLYLVSDVRYTR